MGAGSFPIDLILLGMIAAFLVLRLRSVLGRRTGFEQAQAAPPRAATRPVQAAPTLEGRAEPPPRAARRTPEADSSAGRNLARLRDADRGFDPARFLDGAEQAFRLIVAAFANGDRAALRPLLTADTYATFDAAITARDAAGERQRTEIRQMQSVTLQDVSLRQPDGPADRRRLADIVVRFVSDQTNLTLDGTGRVVAGVDAITEIADLWTFERDLAQSDPAWRLASARSD